MDLERGKGFSMIIPTLNYFLIGVMLKFSMTFLGNGATAPRFQSIMYVDGAENHHSEVHHPHS